MDTGQNVNRQDRMDPPRTLATGARVVPVVLIRVGDQRYPWGVERTDAEALNDEGLLASLAGIPVLVGIDDIAHPDKVRVGDDGGTERAGTLINVRFDADEQAIAGSLVIDTPAGLSALRRGVRGVSLSYDVQMDPAPLPDGTRRRARLHSPDHVLLTRAPRGGPLVGVRADSARRVDAQEVDMRTDADGGTMEWDPTKWPEIASRMDGYGGDIDALKGRMDAAEVSLKKRAEQEAKEPEHRGDSIGTAGAWLAIFAAANMHKVELPATATLADARKAVGAAVVGKERADSLSPDALDLAIELAAKPAARADAVTLDAWGRQIKPVAADVDPATGAKRADSTVSPLRGA